MKREGLSFLALFIISVVAQNDTCITNPTDIYCKNYHFPYVDKDISMICKMMENMAGCEVEAICVENKYDSIYCEPFSILKDLCEDMPMKSCKNYTSMCQEGSRVLQCQTKYLPLNSTLLKENINDICSNMYMDGCEQCSGAATDCNVLDVYSRLCMAMPNMNQCAEWKSMCTLIPDWSICSASRAQIPEMRMYFHVGYVDYVLFKQWVPTNSGYYVGTWIVVVFMGIIYEFMKAFRVKIERKWAQDLALNYQRINETDGQPGLKDMDSSPFRWNVDVPRSFLQFLEVGWGFLLMLIAMTFNVGLFIAVCVGAGIGTLIFGRYIYSSSYTAKASCH